MDPLSVASLLAVHGVKALSAALFGDTAGAVAGDLAKLLQQADNTDHRLTAIEDDLRDLKESEYARNLPKARRYLERAYLVDRETARRQSDLERAETCCVDAAHAAVTPRQRVTAEHLLMLILLSRGDTSAARDNLRQLDASAGDAVTDCSERVKAAPEAALAKLLKAGRVGDLSLSGKLRKWYGVGDERTFAAAQILRAEASEEFGILRSYLADVAAIGKVLGVPTPTDPRRFDQGHLRDIGPPSVPEHVVGLLTSGEPVSTGGVSCRIVAPRDPRDRFDIQVALSPERDGTVHVLAKPGYDVDYSLFDWHPALKPGQSMRTEIHSPEGFIQKIGWVHVQVSGFVFYRRAPMSRLMMT